LPVDYREKEQEFLGSLKEDTGRDLDEWMRAITAANLAHRNEVIDWLRRQGFRFSRASWLERVHHNGGRAIYADQPAARSSPARPRPRKPSAVPPARPFERDSAPPEPSARLAAVAASAPADLSGLEPILAKAKAFRPLAQFLLREAGKALPSVRFFPSGDQIVFEGRQPFALLTVSPRELRLALTLATRPFDAVLKAAKPPAPARPGGPDLTHVVILTDARQINEALIQLLKDAERGNTSA